MKRNHMFLMLSACVVLLLIGCEDKNDTTRVTKSLDTQVTEQANMVEQEENIIKPVYLEYSTEFDTKKAFEDIFEMTNLSEKDIVSNSKAEEWYKLSQIQHNGYEIRRNNDYEVAVIELKDTNQSFTAISKISDRINSLGASEKTYVVEQNKGIVTFVYGKEATKVSNLLTKSLKEM